MAGGYSKDVGAGSFATGSDTWNVAEGFTRLKILRQMVFLDQYETVAQFGTLELDLEMDMIDGRMLTAKRIEALQRMSATLKQLIGNVFFAIKKEDKPKLTSFLERIQEVENSFDKLSETITNDVNKTEELIINEKHFSVCLGILQNIKVECNTPMNKAGLIFRESEEIDLDKVMGDIAQGG